MPLFTDMMGDEFGLAHPPKRIVSLVPSQTELLYDLGLDEEVVGITKFCIHPEKWFRTKARVGGTKKVDIDKVAALKPDLIIANREENVREQVEALREIAPVWVSDIHNLEGAVTMILSVGMLVNKMKNADVISSTINNSFAALRNFTGSSAQKVAYGIWRDPWMWAGGDTFIADVLKRMGWENVLAEVMRYPTVSLEALAAYDPQLVLLSSEPYPFKEKHLEEVAAAVPDAKILLVDGELFSWYGSRLLHTVPYLKKLLATVYE